MFSNNLFVGTELSGDQIIKKQTKLCDILTYYLNQPTSADLDSIIYEVSMHENSKTPKDGDLFFGISNINSGDIDGEYYMTKGHFHADSSKAEYYWGISGKGLLLLMDRDRNYTVHEVYPGSLLYIAGHLAHRLVNIGDDILSIGACWHSTSGYDYETIKNSGFPIRIFKDTNSYKTIII